LSWRTEDGLIDNRIRSIIEDHQNNIWIGTSDGISIYNGNGFKNLDESNGLSNDRIRSLTVDHFNNIWVGTYFGGIMRFNHQDFVAYTTRDGLLNSQILTITADEKGDIIVGTYEGVSKLKIFNEKLVRVKSLTTNNGLIDNAVHSIFKDENGYYWYGSRQGISILKGNDVIKIEHPSGLEEPVVNVIKKINNIYWIGTENGLITIETSDYQNFETKLLTKEDGLAGTAISEIKAGKNDVVWVSFLDGRITRIDKDKMVNPELPDEASEISAFALDQNNEFWIGTNGNGLFHGKYEPETHAFDLKRMSTATGLNSNYIFSILAQKNGNIWLGHENGLDLITTRGDSSRSIQSYGPDRGFFGLQNNPNAAFEDQEGHLWFGTVNGLFCLQNDRYSSFDEGKFSTTYLTSVKLDGNTINWENSAWCKGVKGPYQLPEGLSLPYNENNISFEFIGLNYINPQNIRYSWKLEGYDREWKGDSPNQIATYTNLDPGSYTFQIRSSNEHGVISGEVYTFEFNILKPWWSTWLVRIVAVLLGMLILTSLISLRTRQLRRKQRSLEKTISERTEEITAKNSELEHKNKEILDSIQYSRRIQYSILPGKEKMSALLPAHFVLYKPKDIVSGDFYWVESNNASGNSTVFMAVADCTGHGVPGAMVSLIGTRALNSSVREHQLFHPADILNQTNTIMLEAFTDEESGAIIKDGMDIALCAFSKINEEIHFEFAGAHNALWIIRSNQQPEPNFQSSAISATLSSDNHTLYEIKGNKQPIGYFENHVPFQNHVVKLLPGDRIYLTSDGYADQFGGPKGKKFKYKALKIKLLEIQDQPIERHKDILRQTFLNWKGEMEQLDDVCFLGVELT
jgi:ligand-binding sensor domain-containing protein/serine phosphatase RsbU (regulator of sigma subunit)